MDEKSLKWLSTHYKKKGSPINKEQNSLRQPYFSCTASAVKPITINCPGVGPSPDGSPDLLKMNRVKESRKKVSPLSSSLMCYQRCCVNSGRLCGHKSQGHHLLSLLSLLKGIWVRAYVLWRQTQCKRPLVPVTLKRKTSKNLLNCSTVLECPPSSWTSYFNSGLNDPLTGRVPPWQVSLPCSNTANGSLHLGYFLPSLLSAPGTKVMELLYFKEQMEAYSRKI